MNRKIYPYPNQRNLLKKEKKIVLSFSTKSLRDNLNILKDSLHGFIKS